MKHSMFVKHTITLAVAATVAAYAEERVIELPLSGPAYELANEAYAAFARADYAGAADKAREAVRLRPDVPQLRALLDNAEKARRQAAQLGALKSSTVAPAYQAAARAYAALAQKRFEVAAKNAAEAVRLEPRKTDYRLLLADALSGAGRLAETEQALLAGIRAIGADDKLHARLAQLRLQRAATPMASYYRAVQAGDKQAVLSALREAVALAPDVPAYRLILIRSLVDNGQLEEAETQADQALARMPSEYAFPTLRAAIRQQRGRPADARTDFDKALLLAQGDAAAMRTVRLIAGDAALSMLDRERALALLSPLADSDEEAVRARYRDAQRLPAGLPAMDSLAFAFPELDCRTVDDGQVCSLVPGVPPDVAYAAAADAYQALAWHRYPHAVESAKLARHMAPDNRTYGRLLIRSLLGAGDTAEAERVASTELERHAGDAEFLLARGEARQRLAKKDMAREDFDAAYQSGKLAARDEITALIALDRQPEARRRFDAARESGELVKLSDIDIAYLANHVGEHDVAMSVFHTADDKAALPDNVLLDTAYTALQADRPVDARTYFKSAIDAAADGKLETAPTNLLAARREVAELERTWGIFGGVSYGSAAALPRTYTREPVENDALQAGAEVYWRPFGHQRQGQIELFARAFETLHNKAAAATSGAPTLQTSLGARVKPFATQSLFLMASKLIPVGSLTQSNWLAQMSYFTGTGLDMRFDTDSWTMAQFSGEIGRYFHQPHNYALLSMQVGRSYRIGESMIVTPHLAVAGEYDTALDRKSEDNPDTGVKRRAVGVGPGITFRHWFNENRYAAQHSYVDLTLQYRRKVSGDDRATGPYLGLSFAY